MSDAGSGHETLDQLQAALAAAGLASWTLEPGTGRLVWAEDGFANAGWRPSDLFPTLEAWLERIHPEDRPGAVETLAVARCSGGAWRHDHRVMLPGSGLAWCRAAGQVHGVDGTAPPGMTGLLQDLTVDRAAKRGEPDAGPPRGAGEDRNRVLLEELRHRVRNSMATVRAIARHSVTEGRNVEDYAEHLDGRIAAYARVQSAAIQDPLAGLDLELLLRDALGVLAVPDNQARIEGPAVSLRPRVAEQLAIAVHELATNAMLHGALRTDDGRIDLSWEWIAAAEGERLKIRWAETAAAPLDPEGPPGFGTEFLTRSLAYTLGARVGRERDPSGMAWEILLPDPVAPPDAPR